MTQSQIPDPSPLAPGDRAGDFRILSLTGQAGMHGYTVQHYQVEPLAPVQEADSPALLLRRILPPPPEARTEAEWLAAVQARPAAERQAFSPALTAWSDAQASFLVYRERPGQSLAQYLEHHPPLPPQDGELLARGLLGAAAQLHTAGLHLPGLTPAQVWLDQGGGVGVQDLWAALGEGSVGSDLQRIGALLRGAVQLLPAGSPLARLLDALSAPAGAGLPISAPAALRLLDRPAVPPAVPQAGAPAPATAPVSEHEFAAPAPTNAVPAPAPRPLWPWLLPVALALLGGIVYLGLPQLREALQTKTQSVQTAQTEKTTVASASSTAEAPGAMTGSAPNPGDAAQLMTLPASLNLRPAADTAGTPLAAIPGRSVVKVLSQKGDWYKVCYGQQTGWLKAEYTLPVLDSAKVGALMQAAAKGGRVTLARGVYLLTAPLEPRWDTELIGQGQQQTYLLGSGGGSAVLSRDVHLSLQNLTVAWAGREAGAAVRVERGQFTGQNIWLTGAVPSGTQQMQGSGLWLRSGAQATVSDSLFSRNTIGISVEDSTLTLSGSRLEHNSITGVRFSGQTGGDLHDNLLDSNAESGAVITGSAKPALRGNRFQGRQQRGVEISGAAAPTLEDNRISGGQNTVSVGGQAQPQLRGNQLSDASQESLLYLAQASGSAEGNTISGSRTGIRLGEAAAPTLRSNQLLNIHGSALDYSGTAGGEASENVIEGAEGNGIVIAGQAAPVLEGNRISGGRQSGVVLQDKSRAQLRRNTVQQQAQNGIVVRGEAAPVLEQNALLGNGGYGLVFKEAAGGTGERNLCQNNRAGRATVQLNPAAFGPLFGRDGCLDGITWPPPVPPEAPAASAAAATQAPAQKAAPAKNAPSTAEQNKSPSPGQSQAQPSMTPGPAAAPASDPVPATPLEPLPAETGSEISVSP
ncbi:right-handed parallel beta-helix repeat-containing protein [Deinococcus sp. Marseille-Q6407]|uniref:right-handed parallel beta-helix repeat-containing protein n=1 Tax=Deinococcus sp. Marseille-Q6407 TaxID=2969223 RepID=UPI0021C059A6|nr:right-handed parallel beta-helix repeat-containing protein [Deinococcus sp. Marseille-Q6407]